MSTLLKNTINRKKHIALLFILCSLMLVSCNLKLQEKYEGCWRIVEGRDIQDLLDTGLEVNLVVNGKLKQFEIWTYVDGDGVRQNTGRLFSFANGYYQFCLSDLEPSHYGATIYGTLKLIDEKLHYSTGVNHNLIFEKRD